MIAPWFAIYYAKMDRVVQRYGWALTLHGSLQRDLDLVLIPWLEDAEPVEVVLGAIEKFIKGSPYYREYRKQVEKNGGKIFGFRGEEKPHGRKAYSLYVGIYGQYLDISAMPRKKPKKKKEPKNE